MAITGPEFIVVVGSNNLTVETSTVSAFELVILVALVTEIVTTWFRNH